MAWNGWFALDGNEFINATRVEQYAKRMRLSWSPEEYDAYELPLVLGDGLRYTSPLQDNAPWVDPDVPASWEFLGVYPIDVTGIEDSTRGSSVTEYTVDGGAPGRLRHATRSVVFNCLLVATTEAGAEYGQQWLKAVLLGGPCSGTNPLTSPFGSDLCYFSTQPMLDVPDDLSQLAQIDGEEVCMDPLRRTLRKFAVVGGPSVVTKYEPTDGALWQVQFTGVAGVPWEFGAPTEVITGFLGPVVEAYDGVTWDPDGFVFADVPCEEPMWGPVNDPLCPQFIAPPAPVTVPLGCTPVPTSWMRRMFTIPKELIPLWTDALPTISITTGPADLRSMRLRFYSDPFEQGDPNEDQCSFCGDILISYAPANSTIVFDAASQVVYCDMPGGVRRRADALVFGADGQPFDWPALSCGNQYIVTLDLPRNPNPVAAVDMALVPRFR
jgi:hypothetical protein